MPQYIPIPRRELGMGVTFLSRNWTWRGDRMSTSLTHRISASAVVLSLARCTATHVVANPQQFIDTKRPGQVWVTTPDNSVVALSHPEVQGDTLVGFANGTYRAMPMADVKLIRARV